MRYIEAVWRQIRRKWPMGSEFCPARAKWNWNHCSHKLVNADKCVSERFGKDSKPYTSSVSQDIHSTHSHLGRSAVPVSPERVGDLAHTQRCCDYLSRRQAEWQVIMFCRTCFFVAWNASSPDARHILRRPCCLSWIRWNHVWWILWKRHVSCTSRKVSTWCEHAMRTCWLSWSRIGVSRHVHWQKETQPGDGPAPFQSAQESSMRCEAQVRCTT